MAQYLQPILGLTCLLALAWVLSEARSSWRWRLVGAGLGIQIGLAVLALNVPLIGEAVGALNAVVLALDEATRAGTSLVFGYLGGGALPFDESFPGAAFVLAFRALPLVLVMSALSAVLWHWGVLPRIIAGLAWVLRRGLGIGGAIGLGAAANILVGMIEAALLVRPHIATMSRADLFAMMTCGLTTIAGTVFVLYATILGAAIPNVAGHLLIASLISAPAALVVARIMVPASEETETSAWVEITSPHEGTMDAIVTGITDGLRLLLNIVATLIVFVALVALVNQCLGLLPDIAGAALSLERLLGWLLAPLAWLIGIPWSEAVVAGGLIGTKIVLNELIAYLQLSGLPEGALSERSRVIMLYALCSFANFGSVGITVAGLVTMAPERRNEIVGLGMKALLAGSIATMMTGAVVALLV
ncbi:MAG: nucleoside:proton symporter [Alphaproteobacteria bacterium]|jgi:CNT family concentrative nucleoside transporter|nr:nucleoside:proton symporter [Alphaproteobacteria bacterium]